MISETAIYGKWNSCFEKFWKVHCQTPLMQTFCEVTDCRSAPVNIREIFWAIAFINFRFLMVY